MPEERHSDTLSASGAAFEQVAARYDAEATTAELSRWLRARVWERLAAMFHAGERVLEIGCGTGEDAIWLAGRGVHVTATDASPAMLEETARKAQQAGVQHLLDIRQFDLALAGTWDLPGAAFDGAFSNYGPLNCIGEWRALGQTLARVIRPGGRLGFAVMGPLCPWETAWYLLHLEPRRAGRRWRGQALAHLGGVTFPVYYPTPARLRRELGAAFRRRALLGLGVFLPPGDAYHAVGQHPRLARLLLALERLTAARWPFKYLGDHFWLELERC